MDECVKIAFELPEVSFKRESVWAEPLGQDLYRLMNIPFYAFGYAEGDIVRCDNRAGYLTVTSLVQSSGNGTLRLLLADSAHSETQFILDELVSVGCGYERASEQLVAVTTPPTLEVSFSQLANYLNGLDSCLLIGWEIGKRLERGAMPLHASGSAGEGRF
jgi:hypothetical protein